MDVVYFELNNWSCGEYYPNAEPFLSWMGNDLNLRFADENWVKENKLVVVQAVVDMSVSFNITAPREWVEKNCPELLTKYTQFIRVPEDEEWPPDPRIYSYFLEYKDCNIGITYDNSWWGDPEDSDNEEDDDDTENDEEE